MRPNRKIKGEVCPESEKWERWRQETTGMLVRHERNLRHSARLERISLAHCPHLGENPLDREEKDASTEVKWRIPA